jgi:DNA polymerase-1
LYHPAYLLRKRGTSAYRDLEHSFIAALEELADRIDNPREVPDYNPTLDWSEPRGVKTPTLIYSDDRELGFDFEAVGTDPRTARPLLLSLYDGQETVVTDRWDRLQWAPCCNFAHNAQYDLVLAHRLGIPLPERCFDTMTAAYLLGERQLGLKDLARKHLGVSVMSYEDMLATEGWGPKLNYSAQDAVLAYRLADRLRAQFDLDTESVIMPIEEALSPILARSSIYGIEVDQQKVAALLHGDEVKLASIRLGLATYGDFNPNSPEQRKHALEKELGIKIKDARRDTLKDLHKRYDSSLIPLLIAHSVVQKALGTYLNRLHGLKVMTCEWHPTGTETGRLSSSNPNMQNLPKRILQCLKARDGYSFVIADYSQLELRIAAFLSEDEHMMSNFRSNRDMHRELAESVYPVYTDEMRVRAKTANFEVLYGGGHRKLMQLLGIPELEARRLHAAHRSLYPTFHAWVEEVVRRGYNNGYVTTFFGRRRYLWDRDSNDPALVEKVRRMAINTPIQGTGADFTKMAMVTAASDLGTIGGWIPLQIHDSIIAEVPTEHLEEGKVIVEEAMLSAIPEEIREIVPFVVDVKESQHLA